MCTDNGRAAVVCMTCNTAQSGLDTSDTSPCRRTDVVRRANVAGNYLRRLRFKLLQLGPAGLSLLSMGVSAYRTSRRDTRIPRIPKITPPPPETKTQFSTLFPPSCIEPSPYPSIHDHHPRLANYAIQTTELVIRLHRYICTNHAPLSWFAARKRGDEIEACGQGKKDERSNISSRRQPADQACSGRALCTG